MRLLYWLTGGRPMRNDGFAFTDKVTGRMIYHWTDKSGRKWIAENRWSLFRVESRGNIFGS